MREYEENILRQYCIEVNSTRKIRGAVLCDTDQGLFLLREAQVSERRISLLYHLCAHLREHGYPNVDILIPNAQGDLVSEDEDGEKYILTRWFAGRECDIRRECELLEATRNLARLHLLMRGLGEEGFREGKERTIAQEYGRHNRELKKVRKFIRRQPVKGEFELAFLGCFDEVYEVAQEAEMQVASDGFEALYRQSREEGILVHGEYNYHNVWMTENGIATTNFYHSGVGIQMEDFYYFLRKAMEKCQWNIPLGREMIRAYHSVKPLEKEEMRYLNARIKYPEKFWKIANLYYHSNKAWIPEKNIEKMQKEIRQIEEKKLFLKSISTFLLPGSDV